MRWLLFLSRLAFICNVCFLLAFSLKLTKWIADQDLSATIIVIGFVMVVLFNPLVNLCYLVLALVRRKALSMVPAWLITANIFFLLLQFFYILYLNDTSHT